MTKAEKPGDMKVTVPDIPNIAIIGYYLLFIIDRENVPSKGQFIRICKKSNCFIATAVYGYDSEEVGILRQWRDELQTSISGRLFIRTYETISPDISRVLKRKTWLKTFFRIALNRVVDLIKYSRDSKTTKKTNL